MLFPSLNSARNTYSAKTIFPGFFVKKDILIRSVSLIILLMIINVIFLYYNSRIIEQNRLLKERAEQVNYNVGLIFDQVVRGYDIGMCQFALTLDEKYFSTFDFAYQSKDSVFYKLSNDLKEQQFKELQMVNALEDSVEVFAKVCRRLYVYAKERKSGEFQELFAQDYGYRLYKYFVVVRDKISTFEKGIIDKAGQKYEAALILNYFVQVVIFIIAFLTLFYAVVFTKKSASLKEQIINMEKEQSRILKEQNSRLESMVLQRTEEIQNQNQKLIEKQAEISVQKDLLEKQNISLYESQLIIEKQNQEIQLKNIELEKEVALRTEELVSTNKELITHNNQLEQFAYVTAHNLRSPVARVLGLTSLLEINDNDPEEREFVFSQVVSSVKQLDTVIQDLNLILEIRKNSTIVYNTVNFKNSLEKVKKILEAEITQTNTVIEENFSEVPDIASFSPYIESILYNLLSNAIKYRHPSRTPLIQIHTAYNPDNDICLTITDNGLGIDLKASNGKIFNIYKRFHTHTEGKGLGLYLVKTQIQNLGGTIEVLSEPDKGTSFIITFLKNITDN